MESEASDYMAVTGQTVKEMVRVVHGKTLGRHEDTGHGEKRLVKAL